MTSVFVKAFLIMKQKRRVKEIAFEIGLGDYISERGKFNLDLISCEFIYVIMRHLICPKQLFTRPVDGGQCSVCSTLHIKTIIRC